MIKRVAHALELVWKDEHLSRARVQQTAGRVIYLVILSEAKNDKSAGRFFSAPSETVPYKDFLVVAQALQPVDSRCL
jgi:hypothetical protein